MWQQFVDAAVRVGGQVAVGKPVSLPRPVLETQRALQKCVTAPVPQSVFDALTSHAHNFGWPRTCASQAVMAINRGDLETGCDRLAYGPDGRPVWAYVGTKYVQGLHNR